MHKEFFWTKFKNWTKTPTGKKTIPLIGIVMVVLCLFGYTIYHRYFTKIDTASPSPSPTQSLFTGIQEETKKCLLDGTMYTPEDASRHPLGIMVENHVDARPQSGLSEASIVYEAIAEGGITRFLAIYGPHRPEKVGPVRSARTYYLDWDLEYDAFYAHVGGNIDALDLIPKIGIKDLDQFSVGSNAYWRVPKAGIATEHTMYTDTNKLYTVAKEKEWDTEKSNFTSWEFKADSDLVNRPDTQNIKIDFSSAQYSVSWKYDKEKNQYSRFMAGIAHNDAVNNTQLTAKNIIIQTVDRTPTTTRINEAGWKMDTVGEGEAKIYLDGKEITGTWKKDSQTDRTIFYDSEQKQIKFNAGQFWIEIVPPDVASTVE